MQLKCFEVFERWKECLIWSRTDAERFKFISEIKSVRKHNSGVVQENRMLR